MRRSLGPTPGRHRSVLGRAPPTAVRRARGPRCAEGRAERAMPVRQREEVQALPRHREPTEL